MKLMHLSDLHLGKKLNEFSLLEDQKYILKQLLAVAAAERPDAVLLAGDIYDKGVPPAEAVQLCDDFLTELASLGFPVCVISGNHDSAERLAFGARLMQGSGVHVAACYTGQEQRITLHDAYGPVNIYLLPFLKPATVRHCLDEREAEQITGYHAAVQAAAARLQVDASQRNVLVAHQFVTGAQTAGSEAVSVGGLDNVGAEAFAGFDYVALGHIHSAQNIGGENIRYCGAPLKYSFDEWRQQKSVTIAELGAKGSLQVRAVPLKPWRELRKIKGTYDEVMQRDFYENFPVDSDGRLLDFYHVTLTDEEDVVDAALKLRSVYKNLLQLSYDNLRTRRDNEVDADEAAARKSSLELIEEFYALQNNQELGQEQKRFVQALLQKLEGEA